MEYILCIIILNKKKESLQVTDHNAGLCVILSETNQYLYDIGDIPLQNA